MSREKAREILGEGATEEQITNFLNAYHSVEKERNQELETLKQSLEKYSDYDAIKQQLDDINKANMTEQEKLAKMKEETEANYKKAQTIYNTAKAKEILAGYDMSDEDIEMLVSSDEAKTIANANRIKAKFDSYKDTVARKTKEDIMSQNIQPNMEGAVLENEDKIMTKEKFDKLSMAEQKAWKDANIDKYHEFYPAN